MFKSTTALYKIAKLDKRLRCVQGGTAAGKTVSILLFLIEKAQLDKSSTITSVVSETFPHLRKGAIRDFLDILKQHNYYEDNKWNKTDFIYEFQNGSKIEFFSADQPGKVRGPRRDRLFLNEANNVDYEIFTQLEIRTSEFIFLDWNPVSDDFWFYEKIQNKRIDYDFIVLNYKDNEALNPTIVEAIEVRREHKNWYKIYGLGELGDIEGRIYSDWQLIDNLPHEARLERYGLDFGYSNDPTAIIAVYYYNGGWILDEKVYQLGMSNREIVNTLKTFKPALTVADSAEPKSIDEIRGYGLNITGAEKGKDSVVHGIQIIQDQPISVTKLSINLLKEYRNYLWMTDKNGKILNEPEDKNNDCMDAIRYAMTSLGKLEQQMSYLERIFEDKLGRTSQKELPNLAR